MMAKCTFTVSIDPELMRFCEVLVSLCDEAVPAMPAEWAKRLSLARDVFNQSSKDAPHD